MADRPDGDYLTVQEAAAFLGVSAQTLRRWDGTGKLTPLRHPVSHYRFYRRVDLEPLRLTYQRAKMESVATSFFQSATARIADNERLRDPQREAHASVMSHFAESNEPAIVQIPVGCGKTGVIAIVPFGVSAGRVLVIAPNTTIRKSVAEALDIASPKCFFTRNRVLTDVSAGPFCAVLDGPDANIHDCIESQFVVTNIQQLASSADRWLPQFPPNFFDMILVDEGHHNVAESWRRVFERFPHAKVVSLTATPFRSDGQRPTGKIVYRYAFARAMLQGYIKQVHSASVAPSELYFTFRGMERRHTLDEVMRLREEAWFRKGVALAPECNRHIVEASIVRCLSLRERTGRKHQIIAAACSVDHARQVRALYGERGLEAREIYAELDEDEKEAIFSELRQGRLDVIVQVQMLGEGFDHPPLSVAAIFRPFRSLSAYVQFVGRAMRVIEEGDPGHPDNHAFIVSHVGLNNDAHWDDFRDFDLEDQALLKLWLEGKADGGELPEGRGKPRRFDSGMQVQDEIVSHFISSLFLDPEDDRVLDVILKQKVPGTPCTLGDLISREALREKMRVQRGEADHIPKAVPVSPQRRRKHARVRLRERSNSVVARVLADLGLHANGREVGRAIAAVHGAPNLKAITRLLNTAIDTFMGIGKNKRSTMTADQAERGLAALDMLADKVRDEIRGAVEE